MIPIMYCGNDGVFDGMLISLLSVIKYTKDSLCVHVLTMDLTEMNPKYKAITLKQVKYLESMIQEVNKESKIFLDDVSEYFKKDMKDCPNLETSYGPYTIARLFADYIPNMPDIILYMDTDTVAHGDISSVFETNMDGYEYAAAIDYLGKIFIHYNYQNAGVLLLNMALIKQNGFFARTREYCRTKKMFFPDQTALNRMVKRKKFISSRYNDQRRLHKDTVIQHFCKSIRWFPFFHTINIKPWNVEQMHNIYKNFEYDDILNDYLKRKETLGGINV